MPRAQILAQDATKVTGSETARQPRQPGKATTRPRAIDAEHLLVVEGSALADVLVDVEIANARRASSPTTHSK